MTSGNYDIEEIKRRFDMVAYAVAHLGGRPERHGAETHLVGAKLGGFRVNVDKGVFRHEVEDVGGDALDLVGYVRHGRGYFVDRGRYFADVLAEAARWTGSDATPSEPQAHMSPSAPHGATATKHDAPSHSLHGAPPEGGAPSAAQPGTEPFGSNEAPSESIRRSEQRVLVAIYTYRDAGGGFLFEARKYKPRGYSYRRYTEDGTPILGIDEDDYELRNGVYVRTHGRPAAKDTRRLPAVRRVLYHLPELRRAVADGRTIFIVEGEKDVETLHSLGIAATTNPMGAGKWLDEFSAELQGADVVILPDNDAPGHRHADRVAQSLTGIAASVMVLDLPHVPERGDVSDWVAGGGTADELLTLADAAAYPAEDTTLYEEPGVDDGGLPHHAPEGTGFTRNERSAYPLLPRDPFTDLSEEDERALTIPEEVYEDLPHAIRVLAGFFETGAERDAFLTAALPVIGAAGVNTIGERRHDQDPMAIYTAVIGLPGAGKGVIRFAYRLGRLIHQRLRDQSEEAYRDWIERAKAKDANAGAEPPHRSFFLAGNASKRALIDDLAANNGVGMIFETEIVTIANTMGQDWGDVYDVYLRAFHCEPLHLSRKGDGKVFVEHPALFIALSGTPAAFNKLIPTTEDGLFSRFAVYRFEGSSRWISCEPGPHPHALLEAFDNGALWLDGMHRSLWRRTEPLRVRWTHEQWEMLNTAFSNALKDLIASGADASLEATVKRLGLLAFRIGGILSQARAYNDGVNLERVESLTVDDADARSGIALALVFYRHALRFAATMPRTSGPRVRGSQARFFHALPEGVFGRSEYTAAAERSGVTERSAQRYLAKLIKLGLIAEDGYGRYRKLGHQAPHADGNSLQREDGPNGNTAPKQEDTRVSNLSNLSKLSNLGGEVRQFDKIDRFDSLICSGENTPEPADGSQADTASEPTDTAPDNVNSQNNDAERERPADDDSFEEWEL